MSDPSKYLKTWTLPSNSLLLRYYLWVWGVFEVDRSSITFCKLFWGVCLSWLVPILLVVASPIFGLAFLSEKFKERVDSKKAERANQPPPEPKAPRTGPSRREKILTWFVAKIDVVSAFFQRHPLIGKATRFALLAVAWVIAAAAVLSAFGAIAYAGYAAPIGTIQALEIIGTIIGGALVLIGVGYGLAFALDHTWFGDFLHDRALNVGHFFCAIGRFLASGYYSVKYRSCPRVVVADA